MTSIRTLLSIRSSSGKSARRATSFGVATLLGVGLLCTSLPATGQDSGGGASWKRSRWGQLDFSSVLKASDGERVSDAAALVEFSIYGQKVGGHPLWVERQSVDTDSTGRYRVDLGSAALGDTPNRCVHEHRVLWVEAKYENVAEARKAVVTVPQGVYQDCNTDGQSCSGLAGDTALSQLQQIAAGHFSLVLNYSAFWGTAAQVKTFASEASNLGVNIIWSFDDPDFATYAGKSGNYLISDYGELSASCKCSTNQAFIQYVVNLVKNLPATWGYSIADEPDPATGTQVKALYNLVHAADPSHPAIVNATYDDATLPTLADLQKNLDPFHFADVLVNDYYPIGTGAPASDTIQAAENVQNIANTYGKQSGFVLQAYSWAVEDPAACGTNVPCTYPTVNQMQTMLDDVAAHMTPQFLLWYSYWDTVQANQWQNLITAANPQ